MLRAGAPRIFAVAGAAEATLIDAAQRAGLAVTFARSERSACIMAAVTGELVEAPGAVVVSDLGANSEAARGLADAFADRSPLIVIAQRPVSSIGAASREAVAEKPLVKATVSIEPRSAAERIAHATCLALTEPCGPVLLELAADTVTAAAEPMSSPCRPARVPAPVGRRLDDAAQIIARASRPVLIAGRQCRTDETAKWLRAFAEALPAPVLVTPKAKGVFPDPHPLHLGVVTMDALPRGILDRADLIVAIGVDAIELGSGALSSNVPLLRLAASLAGGPENLSELGVSGDVALLIEELAPRLRARDQADWDVAELDRLKRNARRRPAAGTGLAPNRVVQIARELTPAGTIAAVDGVACRSLMLTLWDAVAPREFLISNRSDAAGFALPAAIGARLAYPDRYVLCVTEPDGLGTSGVELETAACLGLPIIVILVGDVSARAHAERAAVARSAGVAAVIADSEATFRSAVGRALEVDAPTLVVAHAEGKSTV